MDDRETFEKILAGDRKTLHTFYQTYAPKLLRHIEAKVNSPSDAEEILQDTLYAFLEAIRDFQGSATLKTFIFAIVNHKIIDFYRRKKIKQVVFSRLPQLEALISPLFSPEEELDATLLKDKVKCAFDKLLPHYRDILILKYMENFSVEDIARKLSVTFKSAESRIFRARKAFVEVFLSI